jgi:hypothetical protein
MFVRLALEWKHLRFFHLSVKPPSVKHFRSLNYDQDNLTFVKNATIFPITKF